jgi:endo-1,4-beta-xylanase
VRKKYTNASFLLLLGGALLIGGLIIYSRQPRTPRLPKPPLKELADRHKVEIGNFAILSRLNEKPYRNILIDQHDFVLADNTPNWYFTDGGLRPSPDSFNFKQMDEVMQFAKSHNMPVQAHHFLWGEEKWLPDWLKNGNYSKAELYDLMEKHIKVVGNRYKGQIREWTVVNEAFSRGEHIYGLSDWWADHTDKEEYIDKAFRWARQADPHAQLLLNDFLNESENGISNAMYDYTKGALKRGVPIDGIGMQMHIDGTHPPTKDEVIANMKRFSDLGLDIYVTEFDVNMNDVQAEGDDKDAIQANIYYEMMRACIESKACHSFAMLGITDRETWYNHMGLDDARPLPFDRAYQPKPAYFALRRALEEQ